eukprot:SAG31_NODE_1186_length_9492_cov_70.124987_2_plen_90_part_00
MVLNLGECIYLIIHKRLSAGSMRHADLTIGSAASPRWADDQDDEGMAQEVESWRQMVMQLETELEQVKESGRIECGALDDKTLKLEVGL